MPHAFRPWAQRPKRLLVCRLFKYIPPRKAVNSPGGYISFHGLSAAVLPLARQCGRISLSAAPSAVSGPSGLERWPPFTGSSSVRFSFQISQWNRPLSSCRFICPIKPTLKNVQRVVYSMLCVIFNLIIMNEIDIAQLFRYNDPRGSVY